MPRESECATYECSYHLHNVLNHRSWHYRGTLMLPGPNWAHKAQHNLEEGRFFCGFAANTNFLPGLWACYYLVIQSVIVLLQTLSSTSWTWLFASNLHVNSKDELTLFVVTRQREIHPKHTGTGNVSLPMDQVLNSYLHGCTFGFRLITAYN